MYLKTLEMKKEKVQIYLLIVLPNYGWIFFYIFKFLTGVIAYLFLKETNLSMYHSATRCSFDLSLNSFFYKNAQEKMKFNNQFENQLGVRLVKNRCHILCQRLPCKIKSKLM